MTILRRMLPLVVAGLLPALAVGGCDAERNGTEVKLAAVQDGPVLVARAPYDPQLATKTVAAWQDRVRYDPQSAIGYRELAAVYLALQRESGDISHVLQAERAARRSLAILPRGNRIALFRLSRSLLTQHQFGEALRVVNRATPFDSDAQRLRTDIFLELGRYKEAERSLAQSPPDREDPNYFALRARLLEIEGHSAASLQCLQTATQQAEANLDASVENVAWYHVRQARGLASVGRIAAARQALQRALAIFPADYRAMSALAHLAANDHDWKNAILWSRRATAIVPDPDIIALLGDVYATTGQKAPARQQYQLVETMGRLARVQGVLYDRQRALFYANHNRRLDEALLLARGELKLRRDIYAYDTLAWVCFKKGLLTEAEAAAQHALAFHTQDAMLWYHAGLIAHARGRNSVAIRNLQHALSINPRFHPSAPQHCRALLDTLQSGHPIAMPRKEVS